MIKLISPADCEELNLLDDIQQNYIENEEYRKNVDGGKTFKWNDIKRETNECSIPLPVVFKWESDADCRLELSFDPDFSSANEYAGDGADYFVKRHIDNLLSRDPDIDTIILGCTHYPILIEKIRKYTPEGITLITQGAAVAASLKDYLRRHPEMDALCTKGGTTLFCTTEAGGKFGDQASLFLNYPVEVKNVVLV